MIDQGKRIHERQPYQTQVIFEDEFGEGIFYVHSRDISEGGIFLDCSIPAKIGSFLFLSFCLPGNSAPIRVTGQVVRSQALGSELDGIGVRFAGLSQRNAEQLQKFLTAAG